MVYSILGLNKRNIDYIKKLNPQKSIRLADNKYKTKLFLQQRWIPVPQTYAYIADRKQLLDFDFATLPSDVFVAKPNKWSKGKGVFILERLAEFQPPISLSWWNKFSDYISDFLYKDIPYYPYGYRTKWSMFSDRSLKKKLVAILEWNYTLANRQDAVLVEEKLIPGAWFEQFCQYGLADIRVIVCNLVPVAAMLRIPTEQSGWVANLAQGGMACGIDITTWQIRTIATSDAIYYDNFPDEYKYLYKYIIPFWDDILLHSANTQYFVNMGYVWLDWIITADGPKLLEVNGKAWLEIQNIVWLPLQKVLDKIGDLEIATPQKWVEVARSLFAPAKQTSIPHSKVLYLSQKGILSLSQGWKQSTMDVIIATKPNQLRNYTSLAVVDAIKKSDHVHMKIGNVVLKDIVLYGSDRITWHRVTLWSNTLKNYYIKPVHKSHVDIKFINPKNILEAEVDDLMILDKKLDDISRRLPLLRLLFPNNYLQEFDTFISRKWRYNPTFSYNFPTYKDITSWRDDLQHLRDEHSGNLALQSRFAQLFYDKFGEIEDRINLIYAYKKQNHELIRIANEKLFGVIDERQVLQSQNLMYKDAAIYDVDEKLTMEEIRNMIHDVFSAYGIKKYRIVLDSSIFGRIAFVNARVPIIKLSPTFRWTAWELAWQLEHEIWVHLQRAVNGKKTKRLILQKWTAYYLPDEEWLAVYQAEQKVRQYFPQFYNTAMHRKYVFLHFSEKMAFVELVQLLQDMNFNRTLPGLFRTIMRLKRWIMDTSIATTGTTFLKDKVYLEWHAKISNWIEEGGDIDKFMIGKIKVEDLDFI